MMTKLQFKWLRVKMNLDGIGLFIENMAAEFAVEQMGAYSPDASDIVGYLPQAVMSVMR